MPRRAVQGVASGIVCTKYRGSNNNKNSSSVIYV